MRSKGAKLEIKEYFLHGLPFLIITTILVLFSDFILGTMSALSNLVVFSIFEEPDILASPYASSAIFLVLIMFGCIGVFFFYGYLNRILTERIWGDKQSTVWDRQIGQGFVLVVFLFAVHFPLSLFYWLWNSGLFIEQMIFILFYVILISIIDGIIARYLSTST